MTINGIIDLKIVRGSVNRDIYVNFIEKQLLPHLMTFDGYIIRIAL